MLKAFGLLAAGFTFTLYFQATSTQRYQAHQDWPTVFEQ